MDDRPVISITGLGPNGRQRLTGEREWKRAFKGRFPGCGLEGRDLPRLGRFHRPGHEQDANDEGDLPVSLAGFRTRIMTVLPKKP